MKHGIAQILASDVDSNLSFKDIKQELLKDFPAEVDELVDGNLSEEELLAIYEQYRKDLEEKILGPLSGALDGLDEITPEWYIQAEQI